jgi:hypothetical protein
VHPHGTSRRAPAGYSGTPLPQKLGIRPGARLFLHAAPENYRELVAPLPQGVRFVREIDALTDLMHVFASQRATLAALLAGARRAMREDATLWVSWPKKTSGIASEVSEDVVRELALPLGLVDVKVCAVDETWSGLKLLVRRSERATPAKGTRPATRRRATAA